MLKNVWLKFSNDIFCCVASFIALSISLNEPDSYGFSHVMVRWFHIAVFQTVTHQLSIQVKASNHVCTIFIGISTKKFSKINSSIQNFRAPQANFTHSKFCKNHQNF